MGRCIELADAGGQDDRVRHLQESVLRLQGYVGETDAQYPRVQYADGARAYANVLTDVEGTGEDQHQRREDVAEALLGRDAEHHARETETNDEVRDRDAQELDDRDEDQEVPDAG